MSRKTVQRINTVINKAANVLQAVVYSLVCCVELVIIDAVDGKRSRRKVRAPRPQRTVVYRERAPRVIYVKAA